MRLVNAINCQEIQKIRQLKDSYLDEEYVSAVTRSSWPTDAWLSLRRYVVVKVWSATYHQGGHAFKYVLSSEDMSAADWIRIK